MPHRFDGLNLREEAMATDIEVIAFVVDGSRDAADDVVLLENYGIDARLAKVISGGKSCWPSSDDNDVHMRFRHGAKQVSRLNPETMLDLPWSLRL